MPTEEEARWAQITGGGNTATMPQGMPDAPPPPQPQPQPQIAMPDMKGKKAKREKAPKPPKAERAPRGRSMAPVETETNWSLNMADGPSRQEMEQIAAAELFQALAPSYDLLHAEVPDAASPEDAQHRIAAQLGPHPRDMDAAIPDHRTWKGDALVYTQLKRHYGKPHQGSSFARGWFPGQG